MMRRVRGPSAPPAARRGGVATIPFAPVIDGEALAVTPWRALTDGAGLDVPLVFGNLDRGQPAVLIGEEPFAVAEAEALSGLMRAAWTGFAAHGDPGWPAYGTDRRLVRLFGTGPAVTGYPEDSSRLIWQDHAFRALPLISR
ncbi:hypothetical protein ACFXKW_19610 [Streptomyces sp. NPDC059193]|uniref:hypothetical protein n=1 Tax=Streptomyces sp. NPDC059193 TaxID=3346763 RepID=UPI00369ABADB